MHFAQQLASDPSVGQEYASLSDILSPTNISTYLSRDNVDRAEIARLLPSGLELPPDPSKEDLMTVFSAPQWTGAVEKVDHALRAGGLPGWMMTQMGFPEEAGQGPAQFMQALRAFGKKDQAGGEAGAGAENPAEGSGGGGEEEAGGEDKMDTD